MKRNKRWWTERANMDRNAWRYHNINSLFIYQCPYVTESFCQWLGFASFFFFFYYIHIFIFRMNTRGKGYYNAVCLYEWILAGWYWINVLAWWRCSRPVSLNIPGPFSRERQRVEGVRRKKKSIFFYNAFTQLYMQIKK